MHPRHLHHLNHHHHHWHDGAPSKTWELPLAEHPTFSVVTDFVNIVLLATAPGEAPRLELFGEEPLPHVDVRGEGGVTTVSIGGWLGDRDVPFWDKKRWKRKFHSRLIAHLPTDVHARVRSSAAQVHATGLRGGSLEIALDAGALLFNDVYGRLSLSTEAGRIEGHGIGGTVDVSTSAGAVHLDITHLDPGHHRIRTSMGAAHIMLGRGMPVQIETETTLGASRVDFPQTQGAAAKLSVTADLGAIRVSASSRRWTPPAPSAPIPPSPAGPYRTAQPASEPTPGPSLASDVEVERILERVADGTLTPAQAREMLGALGWA